MKITDVIKYFCVWCVIAFVFSYLFFKSIVAFVLMLPLGCLYFKEKKKELANKRKNELRIQFKELCIAISASLSAGTSMVNAINYAYKELSEMYGRDSLICCEMQLVIKSIRLSIPVEKAFEAFADRTDVDDIKTFSEILNIASRSGGDMINIIKRTANSIGEKIDVENEIQSILSSKKYEQSIMNIVPILIILYMKFTAADTLEVMYSTLVGRIVMATCLVVYIVSYIVGRRIVEIEV